MTIKEYAKYHGVTSQAVYQRIKKSGIDVLTLKDKETGQITQEGIEQLDKLYNQINADPTSNKPTSIDLQRENQLLTNQIEGLQDEILFLRRLLEQEQRLHFEALQRIPEGKKPLLKKLFASRKD